MHLLDQADARIDAEDATGRKMLQQYRREARMMQQLSKPQPRE
jgi:hypothetical protein